MGSEEACIESMTRHVQRVNNIYQAIGKFSHPSYHGDLHSGANTQKFWGGGGMYFLRFGGQFFR
jgi:hypothetical protein